MECRDAQFYLRLRRHTADELGLEVNSALTSHLANCPACASDAGSSAAFDHAVAAAMRAVPIPSGLRSQLITSVSTKQGAILRRKFYRSAAVAAAAIVLVFLGLGIFSSARPTIDTDSLALLAENQVTKPEETTRKWLAEQKFPEELPRPFDYDLLAFLGFEKIQGRDVPVIVFRTSDIHDTRGFAKVYIFRDDGRFDLKGIQDAQSSHARAEVVIDQERFRGVTYVIVHTGGPDGLRPFLITRRGGMIHL